MEQKRTRKMMWVIVLLIIIMGITVAFAILSTQLQINGIAKIEQARWEIKFEDLKKISQTGSAKEIEAPEIQWDIAIGDFEVILTKPGDSIVYTFDVTNAGSIDAELNNLEKAAIPTFNGLAEDQEDKANDEIIVEGNFEYTLTYTDNGEQVREGDPLPKSSTRNMTLKLSYDGISLPTDDVEIRNLGITLLYVQK